MPVETHTAEVAYATKTNIGYPGSTVQATAAEVKAAADINARLPAGDAVTVAPGTIKSAT